MLPVRTFSARGMAAEHVVGVRPVGAAGGRTPSPTVVISTREDDDPLGVATSPCTPSFGSPVSSGFSASPPSSKPKRQMSLVSFVRHSPAPKSAAPARPLASAKPAAFARGWPQAALAAPAKVKA